MCDNDRESSYSQGKTMMEVAREWADGLVEDARRKRLNSESAYGMSVETYVDVTLAGGGPACVVRFFFSDADPDCLWDEAPYRAELRYMEPWERDAVVPLDEGDAAEVWWRLGCPPGEDEADDDDE